MSKGSAKKSFTKVSDVQNLFSARIGNMFNSATASEIQDWVGAFRTQYPEKQIDFWQVRATYDASTTSNTITIILLLEIRTKIKPIR